MKNRLFYIILLLFLIHSSFSYGQEDIDSLDIELNLLGDTLHPDLIIDCFPDASIPEFPGGEDSLFAYLKRMIIYPDSAKVLKISGTVYISFVVEQGGSIRRVKLLRGIGGGCDAVALEGSRNMPNGLTEKNAVNNYSTEMNIPIKFSLDKTETTDSLQY